MLLWDHYSPRSFINALRSNATTDERFLKEDSEWSRTAFQATARSHKFRDRLVFSGQA